MGIPKAEQRSYRRLFFHGGWPAFRVLVKETDLLVHAPQDVADLTRELVLTERRYIETYIEAFPAFLETLSPWQLDGPAAAIVRDMTDAGKKTGVGPMAAVAGAIAEHVGRGLLSSPQGVREVIIENGGDTFIKTHEPVTVGIYAGKSPLSLKVGLRINSRGNPVAVCTSSGTLGHSLSLGRADAVCVVSDSGALADAAATAIANRVRTRSDIPAAIDFGKKIKGVKGLVIIKGDKLGGWGAIELVALGGKKG